MNPGKLRHRITVLEKRFMRDDNGDLKRDNDGHIIGKWEAVGRVWAAYEPVSGREYFRAAAAQATQQVRFIMRYRADITTEKRLRFDEQDYEIRAVIDVEGRRTWLQVIAEVITNG